MTTRVPAVRGAVAVAAVGGMVALLRLAAVNATTAALALLLAVLAVSTLWGLAAAVVMALVAVLAFNFYFLPPLGTLTIADPANWVALAAFLVAALVGSMLSARVRREASEAARSRRELESLYALSQLLLEAGDVLQLAAAIPGYLAGVFGAPEVALYLAATGAVYRHGAAAFTPQRLEAEMLAVAPSREAGAAFAAIRMGTRPLGSFALTADLNRTMLEAVASLLAIALERARALEQLGLLEASRQSERLRSVLLDSIAHDFRTPLTGIKGAVTGLLAGVPAAAAAELLQVIDQESDRLNALIEEAAEMARLEAGVLPAEAKPCAVAAIVEAALEECRTLLGARPVEVRLPAQLALVRADFASAKKVLVRLLENAVQYSPKEAPVTVSAEQHAGYVRISVADRGPGVAEPERTLIFGKFYRGRDQRGGRRGTGMGLPIARALAEAHGGAVSMDSPPGPGSVFVFSLPRADVGESARRPRPSEARP